MSESVDGVGSRIARLRKLRGMKQHQLASLAYVSTSLVKQVEQGRVPASAGFVASAARVLAVDASELYGLHTEEALAALPADEAGIVELRAALEPWDDADLDVPPRSVAGLAVEISQLDRLRQRFRYEEISQALPSLLYQLFALRREAEPGTRHAERVLTMLHDAYRLTATVGGRFGSAEIAAIASERHVALAPKTGDPLRVGVSTYHRTTYHLRNGQFVSGLRLLERAGDLADEVGSLTARSVQIQLHLRSAVLAARARMAERADDHLREARNLRDRFLPPAEPYLNTNAGALNIAVHWCAVPVEYENGGEALFRANQIDLADPTQRERIAHHHIDMARAALLHGSRERCLAELDAAKRANPRDTRTHPGVHETVRGLANADRRSTDSLAGFARWAGIRL